MKMRSAPEVVSRTPRGRDFLDRRPLAAVEAGPLELLAAVLAGRVLVPDAGDAVAERDDARLIEAVAESGTILVRKEAAGDDAAGAFAAGLPGVAVIIGIADIDLVGAKPADHAVGGPQPAIRRAHDRLVGAAMPHVAIDQGR